MSIEVSVHTVMVFDSATKLEDYLASNVQARIIGFAEEIRQAWRSGEPFVFTTARQNYGAVVKSDITVRES